MKQFAILAIFFPLHFENLAIAKDYGPMWKTLAERKQPEWFDESKYGLLINYGIYSVPGINEMFWDRLNDPGSEEAAYMRKFYKKEFGYQDFVPDLTAELYNAKTWTEIAKTSGIKYVVLTAKHFDGFALFKTNYSWNWNSQVMGPKRCILGELKEACEKDKLKLGITYAINEWYNPLYITDRMHDYKLNRYPFLRVEEEFMYLVSEFMPEYIQFTAFEEVPEKYWAPAEGISWMFNDPDMDSVVVNTNHLGKTNPNVGFYTVKSDDDDFDKSRKWEQIVSIDKKALGYRSNAQLSDILTTREIIHKLVKIVSRGGNMLLSVGATPDGRMPPLFESRICEVGQWLDLNGVAIYETKPWEVHSGNEEKVWFTKNKDTLYAIILEWPESNELKLSVSSKGDTKINLLGYKPSLKTKPGSDGIQVTLPSDDNFNFETFPYFYAWTLIIEGSVTPVK